jgi:lipid II:glycine glycyltransferase (peptidoglycan interpeptide bridge formation enzyme)
MAIIIDNSFLMFKKQDIFLSEYPYNVGKEIDAVLFHYCKHKIDLPGYTRRDQLTSTIDLTQESEEIWKKMNRKLRQKIKKPEKHHRKINENFSNSIRSQRIS